MVSTHKKDAKNGTGVGKGDDYGDGIPVGVSLSKCQSSQAKVEHKGIKSETTTTQMFYDVLCMGL